MGMKEKFFPESRFGGFSDIDGTIAFYLRVNALLQPDSVVADFGCGRGAYAEDPVAIRRDLRILRGKACRVIGLDVSLAAADNPFLDEFRRLDPGDPRWPVEDGSIDLCLCDSVLEHLEDPSAFFAEARRVLRDGGYLCIRTTNLWSYVGLFSKLIPNRMHHRVLSSVKEKNQDADTFPTVYRCNTLPRLRSMLRQRGFAGVVYGYDPEPAYLSFSSLAYRLGTLHRRLAPGLVRPVIFAFGQVRKGGV